MHAGSLRLVLADGTVHPWQGRVEVLTSDGVTWGTVCDRYVCHYRIVSSCS